MIKSILSISLVLILLSITTGYTYAQFIPWTKDRPLTWDDFKGKKPHKSKFAAATASFIHYKLDRYSEDSIDVKVYCLFIAKKSWKKSKNPTPYLLKHEQLHFDITELYTRKLRQSFNEYQLAHGRNSASKLRFSLLSERNRRSWHHCQNKYDRQTKHSLRRAVQEKWNKKIAEQLVELSVFEKK